MGLRSFFQTIPFGTHRFYRSGVVSIGASRCPPSGSGRANLGPIPGHVFVFPRAAGWVLRDGEEPFLADANRVVFNEEGDEFQRCSVDGRGAMGTWFAIEPEHLLPHLERRGHGLPARCPGPFGLRHGPCSGEVFRRQALLVRGLLEGETEALRVDESALWLLEKVLACPGDPLLGARAATAHRHARLVEEVKGWFGVHFRSRASLAEISAAVGTSPFHLARIFRARTGLSLHGYRNELRLRAATEAVLAGQEDLTALALELGFASHSHMTDAFRAAFGSPPSALRLRAGKGSAREHVSSSGRATGE